MEPNKLETQFKEKLNSREIKPTEMAWDKLDSMLSSAEEPKRKFTWIYIAASFMGFLLISTVFFNQKGTSVENQKNKIVIQQSFTIKPEDKPSNTLNANSEKSKNKSVAVVRKNSVKTDQLLILKKDSFPNKNNQNQVVELSIINQKTEQESISSQTNAATVDELLARVDQSARLNSNSDPNLAVRVNANQLLEQVDSDLEPAFRQSVFGKVADNLKAVKEAVVNRNRE
jgi:ABC-type Na+ efflux pump permease subunit